MSRWKLSEDILLVIEGPAVSINDGSQVLKRFPLAITFDIYLRTCWNIEQWAYILFNVVWVCVVYTLYGVFESLIEEFKVVALLCLQRGVWEKIFPTSARLDFKLLKLESL